MLIVQLLLVSLCGQVRCAVDGDWVYLRLCPWRRNAIYDPHLWRNDRVVRQQWTKCSSWSKQCVSIRSSMPVTFVVNI